MEKPNEAKTQQQTEVASDGKSSKNPERLPGQGQEPHKPPHHQRARRPTFEGSVTKPPETTVTNGAGGDVAMAPASTTAGDAGGGLPITDGT